MHSAYSNELVETDCHPGVNLKPWSGGSQGRWTGGGSITIEAGGMMLSEVRYLDVGLLAWPSVSEPFRWVHLVGAYSISRATFFTTR